MVKRVCFLVPKGLGLAGSQVKESLTREMIERVVSVFTDHDSVTFFGSSISSGQLPHGSTHRLGLMSSFT